MMSSGSLNPLNGHPTVHSFDIAHSKNVAPPHPLKSNRYAVSLRQMDSSPLRVTKKIGIGCRGSLDKIVIEEQAIGNQSASVSYRLFPVLGMKLNYYTNERIFI